MKKIFIISTLIVVGVILASFSCKEKKENQINKKTNIS